MQKVHEVSLVARYQ